MSERQWNEEQKEAIYSETSNILVSAGAGSGKTAVLTQRVINLLKKGYKINELLILTFTNAAASEMKERIGKAIREESSLKDQEDLLESAYITTFDSYALSIVKKYHYLLNISSNVKIVNESALKLEKYKIIEEVLNEKYLLKEENFVNLIKRFCLKDDNDLIKILFEINNKLDLLVDKEEYLNQYLLNLNDNRISMFWNKYYEKINSKFNELLELYNEIEDSLESEEDENLFSVFSSKLEQLINSDDYDSIYKNINFDMKGLNKTKNINETFIINKKKIAKIRDELKKIMEIESKELIISGLKDNFKYEKELIELIKIINYRVNKLKFDNEMFEFIDIAKLAIKLVKDNPSICKEIKQSIKEIMLDEYQDTSDLQEILISYISSNNVYMVGDIKQSIYRFRNANPKIFLEKYNKYTSNPNEGKVINLMKNYRSREEVLDSINIMFNEVMIKDVGGIDYKKGHEFVFGNLSYNENKFDNQSNYLEIYNYRTPPNSFFSSEEIEAFIIAKDILNKINNNYMIYDKDHKIQRKMEYGDITILLDRKTSFEIYQKIFEYMQIPLSVYKNTNLTMSTELLCYKNIFKLIYKYSIKEFDTSFKHSFMSVARSFIFNYSDETLFKIIRNNDYFNNDIYSSLKDIIDNLAYLSIVQINEKILSNLDIYYKASFSSDIDNIHAIIFYISSLIKDLNDLNYSLIDVINYFDKVIEKDLKIELPVRKNTLNSVKIMSIHASKGLEFNLCYFGSFRKKFNELELKEKIICDTKYGLILPIFINNQKYNNISKYLYADDYYSDEISEKIRLLYVALSRAKEKMIIVGNFEDKKSKKEDLLESRSFYDFIKFSENKLSTFYKFINVEDYELNENYKYYKAFNSIELEEQKEVKHCKINIDNSLVEETSFAKKNKELINEEQVKIMNFGNKMHDILEKIDFFNPNLLQFDINDFEKRSLINFLNSELLKNIKNGKIYKEFEFIYNKNNETKHGFIDLMICYDNYIDIIDYKLSNIDDEEYVKQLKGYKEYIEYISDKPVNLYLYSLLKGKFIKIEQEEI